MITLRPDEKCDPGFPSYRYGPDGAEGIFYREADVPEGWFDHPSLVADEPGNAESLEPVNALRAEYRERFGKKPYMGWDEATLREKLAE